MTFLHLFSIILGIGASFGLLWVAQASPAVQRTHWLLAALLTLIGALIGARAAYVLGHMVYYSAHLNQIVQFWLGGLAWTGALAGGLVLLPLAAKLWQWSVLQMFDRLSRMVLPLGVAAWLGCWQVGVAYGIPLDNGTWWGLTMVDETGQMGLRAPVQLLAALSLIVFLGVLELWLAKTETIGLGGLLVCLVFSVDMLLFSFLRADPAQSWLGLRIETWAAMVYTLLGIVGTIGILLKKWHIPFRRGWLKAKLARK